MRAILAQANRRHVQQLERERKTAREAVAAERRRIARELHDIVSHAVTVIVLQAAGATRVAETDFTKVIVSLGHIQTMGEQAMAELRRLLGVLRASDAARARPWVLTNSGHSPAWRICPGSWIPSEPQACRSPPTLRAHQASWTPALIWPHTGSCRKG